MEIYFDNEQEACNELLALMEESARLCLTKEGIPEENCEFSVSFVSREEIKELNKTYRAVDKVTDVLSFPQFEDFSELPKEQIICLGDIVICEDRAKEQAEEFGHSYEREIVYLFTHSVLHLLGYDHMNEKEKAKMREREEEVMTELKLERV